VSDARWDDVTADVAAAVKHFGNALLLEEGRRPGASDLERYRDDMAFMHAMQSAHNSAEAALLRILAILREEPPTGGYWHRDLLDRLGRASAARPALLPADVEADLHETRNFRHRATHIYGEFDAGRSVPSAQAAGRLIASFPAAIAAFRQLVDPVGEAKGS
jgi:hypothetical protein